MYHHLTVTLSLPPSHNPTITLLSSHSHTPTHTLTLTFTRSHRHTLTHVHLSKGSAFLKCRSVVCNSPWYRRLGWVGFCDPSRDYGRGRLSRSSREAKGTKNRGKRPGQGGALDWWGERGVPVDLENHRVELNLAFLRYLHWRGTLKFTEFY